MEAWYKYDGGEMIDGEYSQDFFANSEMIFTISKSSLLENLLIKWVIKF